MAEGDESKLGQFPLATICNCDFGWTLEGDVSVVRHEGVSWKALHESTALDTSNGGTPFMQGEGVRKPGRERVGGIAPQVLFVIGAVHLLFVVEGFHRNVVLAVGSAHEDVWHS